MKTRAPIQDLYRQHGQAMAEYIYVFPILILLVMGAIQFGFIYQAKSTLNYATFAATRAGALNNGSMSTMVDALTSGMMPLFAHNQRNGGKRDMALLKDAWVLADAQMKDSKVTTITIVNPTNDALSSYSSQSETGDQIPNDNLMYRPTDVAGGNMSIQDANLLKVRVTYCYKMAVPVLNKLIYNLVVDPPGSVTPPKSAPDWIASKGGGSTSKPCTKSTGEYRIPITSEAVVRMQSPFKNPGKWVGP